MNALMESAREFLSLLSMSSGVSGYEDSIASLVMERFIPLSDEVRCDTFENGPVLKSLRAKKWGNAA